VAGVAVEARGGVDQRRRGSGRPQDGGLGRQRLGTAVAPGRPQDGARRGRRAGERRWRIGSGRQRDDDATPGGLGTVTRLRESSASGRVGSDIGAARSGRPTAAGRRVAVSTRLGVVAADGRRAGGSGGATDDGGRNNRWVFCFIERASIC
jgi:hypothetical protein